jgi:glutathione-regulated potassium-efflux system ancillary protein KefG
MQAYQHEGYQRCTITELLRPFERTAQLCNMAYLPPFWISGTHKLDLPQIYQYAEQYRNLLIALREDNFNEDDMAHVSCLNDLIEVVQTNQA